MTIEHKWRRRLATALLLPAFAFGVAADDGRAALVSADIVSETGEDFDETLSQADASNRTDEFRERSPRLAHE